MLIGKKLIDLYVNLHFYKLFFLDCQNSTILSINTVYGWASEDDYDLIIFSYIMILKGPNIETFTNEKVAWWRIGIWDQILPWIKMLTKTDPHFSKKRWGSVFFNFLIQGMVWSHIAIHCFAIISCVFFS